MDMEKKLKGRVMILEQIYFPSPHTWVPLPVQTNGICSGCNLEAYFPDRFSRHSLIKLNLMFKNYTFVFIKLESWKFIKVFTQQPWISGYSELSTALGIRYMRQIRSHSQSPQELWPLTGYFSPCFSVVILKFFMNL